MRIHYFQHVSFENLSMIAEWAESRGHTIEVTKFYEDKYDPPSLGDYDMLVVMGGSMSVNDEAVYPWLFEERDLIREAIISGKYVLGICLGAQQVAKVLGADVKVNKQSEIGWYPIAFHDHTLGLNLLRGINTALTVFHWHSETFDLPKGATSLASSAACLNQGFLYQDKVLALQFHIEMDALAIEKIVSACADELSNEEGVQEEHIILSGRKRYHLKRTLFQLLDNWVE